MISQRESVGAGVVIRNETKTRKLNGAFGRMGRKFSPQIVRDGFMKKRGKIIEIREFVRLN